MIVLRFLQWVALVVPALFVSLAAFPLGPIIALLPEDQARRRFAWFVTPDNPLTGDAGHVERWKGWPTYIQKLAWLWRNRAYGFSVNVLRAKSNGPVAVRGDPAVSNRPLKEGLVIRTTPEGYFQLYYIKRTMEKRCLRVNLGWKLWNEPGHPMFGQYVASINPFMGVS
jgi:hypothetical protein